MKNFDWMPFLVGLGLAIVSIIAGNFITGGITL